MTFLQTNSNIHVHNTRQKCHYHLPLRRSKLGKFGLSCVGPRVWNSILSVNISPNANDFVFSWSLTAAKWPYVIIYFNQGHIPHVVDIWILVLSFCVAFFFAPFALLSKYTFYMWNRKRARKSHRISTSLCSHNNVLLYLYWCFYFMFIWLWRILYYDDGKQ